MIYKAIDANPKSTWITSSFDALELQDSLNANARDHSTMMTAKIFPKMIKILKNWSGDHYTDKEYAMALMYGLNNAGQLMDSTTNISKDVIKEVDETYKALIKKYEINEDTLNTFFRHQLDPPKEEKIPGNC